VGNSFTCQERLQPRRGSAAHGLSVGSLRGGWNGIALERLLADS
jgi:hypothetical protein